MPDVDRLQIFPYRPYFDWLDNQERVEGGFLGGPLSDIYLHVQIRINGIKENCMKRIKGVLVLKEELESLIEAALTSLDHELRRIGSTESSAELIMYPFLQAIPTGIDGIVIDESEELKMDFMMEAKEVKLVDHILEVKKNAQEILNWLYIQQLVNGTNGKKGSVLQPVHGEWISYDKIIDSWVCCCGNVPSSGGFYSCDADGNHLDACFCSGWDNLYRCGACGRVIDKRTLQVIGINMNPHSEREF
jgi:hypothetical protein